MSSSNGLDALLSAARAGGRIALDTEFMGEGRYRTLLCLVQLAADVPGGAEPQIVLLDPLLDGFDPARLPELLADPTVEVVVHAGRQDIALLRRAFGSEVTSVFDTQVAAGFAGLGAQSSYESLLRGALDLRVPKTASFTRWDRRPLTAEQLAYARGDVLHLLDLAAALRERLRALGRLDWAREECEALSHASDERDIDAIVQRLPRSSALPASARAVARALVSWREEVAERRDRPVQSVLGDAALVEVARRRPRSIEQLERIRGVGSLQGSRGRELLAAVVRGREAEPEDAPVRRAGFAGQPQDAPLVALCESLLRSRALDAGIAYELLAARTDLQAIVAAARDGAEASDVRTLRGWRRELVGDEVLRLLAGAISLSVTRDGDSDPRVAAKDAP
ncbi:MAG TPA: HRDC domain-containing protein [Solirubrobacteraceae bacterium]|nr:HRDC domain-containing protein [Solirubrobacteraceae bacterium]